MTYRGKIILASFVLTAFSFVLSAMYFHSEAMQELTVFNNEGVYVRWHINNFNYATYFLRKTPGGVLVEGVIKSNSLPFTSNLTLTWNTKNLVLAEKCESIRRFFSCSKPSEKEIKELVKLLAEGIVRAVGARPKSIISVPKKPESAMVPIADFSFPSSTNH